MSSLITLRNVESLQIDIIPTLRDQRDAVLSDAQQVESVGDEFAEQIAADSLRAINSVLKQVENDRKDVKRPINEFAKLIERTCDEFTADLNREKMRIGRLLADYATERQIKAQEEERKKQAEQRRLAEERDRLLKAEAEARRKEEEAKLLEKPVEVVQEAREARKDVAAAVNAVVQQQIQIAAAPVAQAKVDGLVSRKVPKFEVTDPAALFAAKPELVALVPRTNEINAAIRAGLTEAPGIRIWWDTQVTVRA